MQKKVDVNVKKMVSSEIAEKLIDSGAAELMPNIFCAVVILGTMPVSSCEAERSFSALRRIKNYMRTTTGQNRLSSLTLLHFERDIVNKILRNDMDSLINTFASKHGRANYFF